jgi:hypothetical protein
MASTYAVIRSKSAVEPRGFDHDLQVEAGGVSSTFMLRYGHSLLLGRISKEACGVSKYH